MRAFPVTVPTSRASFEAVTGSQYLIRVGGRFSSSRGSGEIVIGPGCAEIAADDIVLRLFADPGAHHGGDHGNLHDWGRRFRIVLDGSCTASGASTGLDPMPDLVAGWRRSDR